MSTLAEIKQRLTQLKEKENSPIISCLIERLAEQHYQARLSTEQVAELCRRFQLSPVQLALHCISVAACYALTPVSHFFVGAVAIGKSGTFYFGANQEFSGEAIQQSVHAEQSAASHAWLAGETALTDMVVNYTPCGHCRQFMNEFNSAAVLNIHLPHSQNNLLHSYLPDAFGPKDLGVSKVLFDTQDLGIPPYGDPLQQAAISAMNASYAPYSQAFSGVALQAGEQIICGRYAENAAFNPSFLPLQSALNFYRLSGLNQPVTRIVMSEKQAVLSHRAITEALATQIGCELEYICIV